MSSSCIPFTVTPKSISPLDIKLDGLTKIEIPVPRHSALYLPSSLPTSRKAASGVIPMFQGWEETGPPDSRTCGSGSPTSREHISVYPYSEPASNERNNHTHSGRSLTHSPRQRTSQACEKCRDRKTKCSGGHPVCQRCAARGLVCVYPIREKRSSKLRPRDNAGGSPVKRSSSNRPQKSTATLQPLSLAGPPLATFPRYPYDAADGMPARVHVNHSYSALAMPDLPPMFRNDMLELNPSADIAPQGTIMEWWAQVPTTQYDYPHQLYNNWDSFTDRSDSPPYMESYHMSDASSDSGHSGTYSGLRDSFANTRYATIIGSEPSESFDNSSPASSNMSSPSPGSWPSEHEPAIQLAELELAYQHAICRFGGLPPQLSGSGFDEDFSFANVSNEYM